MATVEAVSDSEYLKSLIINTVQELWEDKAALVKFLNVVRRSEGFADLADTLERSHLRPVIIDEGMQELCGAPERPMESHPQQERSCIVCQPSDAADRQETPVRCGEPRAWTRETERAALLTPREIEVFLLLGVGSSNRTIATSLGITERTVKAHVARIMSKIGVESRLQAGLAAYVYQKSAQDATTSDLRQVSGITDAESAQKSAWNLFSLASPAPGGRGAGAQTVISDSGAGDIPRPGPHESRYDRPLYRSARTGLTTPPTPAASTLTP
ncbi:helix-turn-helix transcriptional regulator [Streptomyces sp. SID10815]|uniref:LuxR C-terminal-related transcriptional regulator n=1 Tax=Streptomyces sp. SID10815 TaxID=2706027 RepID=UPI0013C5E325|nr:helix-turn-helix transcriptional regulator [Streptomyces sp. SID10815]